VSERDTAVLWTAEGLREKARAFDAFARWEEEHPHRLEGIAALSAVGCLYDLLPPEARTRETDPEFEGIQRMLAIFERWDRPGDHA